MGGLFLQYRRVFPPKILALNLSYFLQASIQVNFMGIFEAYFKSAGDMLNGVSQGRLVTFLAAKDRAEDEAVRPFR
jgi:hypothetical protein